MSPKFFFFRLCLILSILTLALPGSPALAQSAAVVRVDPASLSVNLNDGLSLSIRADNIANLTALELHLAFNPSVLEVTSVANGGFVAADFVAQNTFDNTAGTVDYAVAQMNRTPASGSGALLIINFRAKANGSSTLNLRGTQAVASGLLLSDANGTSIQASWLSGTVAVGGQAPATATSVPPTAVNPTAVPPTATGPTATARPTTVPATPTAQPSGSILGTHVVRFGESLYCIGRAYKVTPWAISSTNGIWWPYFIFPNQRLLIPNVLWSPIPAGPVCQTQFTASGSLPTATVTPIPSGATATPVTPGPTVSVPTATPVPPSGCRAIYYVRPGDTLYHIAVSYGTTYAELARVNQISNAWLIYAGQRLCIP